MGATPEVGVPPDVDAAAAAARVAQPLWALLPPSARARYVRRAAVAMLDELDELAVGLAEETGWPRAHLVVSELLPAVRGLHALAGEGPSALADRRLSPRAAVWRRSVLIHAPAGVVGVAGPSASPWQEPALEAAAALLAGNGVLLSAAPPLAAQRLRGVFLRAGIPGELIVPVADVGDVCDRVITLPPPTRMGTLLVLGGAPRPAVIEAAVWAAFACAGRHPAAAGRLIASRTAAPGLAEAIAEAAETLDVTPTITTSRAAFDEPPAGPVLAIVETADDDEAIALAATGRGVISIWTADRERGERIARSLPAAAVGIGRHGVPAPAVSARLERYVAPRRLETRAPAAPRLPMTQDVVDAQAALEEARHGRESRRWPALRKGVAALLRAARRQR